MAFQTISAPEIATGAIVDTALLSKIKNNDDHFKTIDDNYSGSLVPIGVVLPFAGITAPTNFLLCDGAAVSRLTYSALFALIGVTYGPGDGLTTFNLPNTQGVFVRGAGSQTIGAETYSATLGTRQNDATAKNGLILVDGTHSHTFSKWYGDSGNGAFNDNIQGYGGAGPYGDKTISYASSNITLNSGDTETRPANIAFNHIIKVL